MSTPLSFSIHDTATPYLLHLQAAQTSPELLANVGEALRQRIMLHLDEKQETPNKQGFPKTGFFAQARNSITMQVTGETVVISLTQTGIRQRYLGGDIHPTGGRKYLTIAASAAAYGKRAADFSNLKFTFQPNDQGYLAPCLVAQSTTAQKGTRARRGSGPSPFTGVIMFWLIKSAHQEPDPTVLPTEAQLNDAATEAVREYQGSIQ